MTFNKKQNKFSLLKILYHSNRQIYLKDINDVLESHLKTSMLRSKGIIDLFNHIWFFLQWRERSLSLVLRG